MRKLYEISADYNLISNRNNFAKTVILGKIDGLLSNLSKTFSNKKIEVVMEEGDFGFFGAAVLEPLKSNGVDVALILTEETDFHYTAVKNSFSNKVSGVIAVGGNTLLSAVRYYSSLNGVEAYAIPTTPYLEEILDSKVNLKTDSLPAVLEAKPFEKIFIDESVILKAKDRTFAKSYISVMSKLTALIDYKINCFLSGSKVDSEVFLLTKRAINVLAALTSYENYKSAILGAQLILSSLAFDRAFDGSGVEVIKTCLLAFTKGVSSGKRLLVAFEKTAKLYHLFFSNDLSDLLSVPDYESDLAMLELETGHERAFFYKNLQIPSEKRRILINALISKTRDDFKKETTIILSVLPSVIKIYNKLYVVNEKAISYKQIKNAVSLGSYLTDKTSVLTLCRDEGILKCAN